MIELGVEHLLTVREAAARLGVHVKTVRRWISPGVLGVRLDVVRLGGTVRTSREALQRFAADQEAARTIVRACVSPRACRPLSDATKRRFAKAASALGV